MEETSPTTAPAPLDRGLILLAITTLIGGFASMLDSTIVSVAIPALSHALHAPLSTLQWVITGYLLTMMAAIPITGWAVERFGARRTWLFALLLFLAGSVLSGASWSAGSLIVFRLLQGFGGGMILPVAQTIVVQAAGPERIGRIMSLVAVPAQLAPICGPVIGGLIIDGLSRRWMFYVNVPICLLAIVMTFIYIPAGSAAPHHKFDVLGLLLLSPGLAAAVFGLSLTGAHGFASPVTVGWLAAGLVLLCGYAVHALRSKVAPMIDLRLFRARAFSAASAVMFLFGVSIFAAMFLLPLYYVQARDASALQAGLLLAPQGLGTLLALTVVGKLADRVSPRPIILVGLFVATVGTLPFVLFADGGNVIVLGIALLVRGLGRVAKPMGRSLGGSEGQWGHDDCDGRASGLGQERCGRGSCAGARLRVAVGRPDRGRDVALRSRKRPAHGARGVCRGRGSRSGAVADRQRRHHRRGQRCRGCSRPMGITGSGTGPAVGVCRSLLQRR